MSLIDENLLDIALSVLPSESFQYKAYQDTTVNALGVTIPTYAPVVNVTGSIQGVDNRMYQAMGLDFSKDYRLVYASLQMQGTETQAQPDVIIYDGSNWNVVQTTDWIFNGWNGVLIVRNKVNAD